MYTCENCEKKHTNEFSLTCRECDTLRENGLILECEQDEYPEEFMSQTKEINTAEEAKGQESTEITLQGFNGLNERNFPHDIDGKRLSNDEWISRLINYSHPMTQSFILQAIYTFADKVISEGDKLIEEEKKAKEEGKMLFISNELWVEIAKFVRLAYKKQYEDQK